MIRDGVVGDPVEPDEIVEEFDYFATAVDGDGEIEPDGEYGVVALEIAEVIYESDERGTTVELRAAWLAPWRLVSRSDFTSSSVGCHRCHPPVS